MDDGTAVQFAVFLDDIDLFDARAFGIGAPEACMLDPQQRLLLEVAAEALGNAGMSWRAGVARTGVYIGISSMDFNKVQPLLKMILQVYLHILMVVQSSGLESANTMMAPSVRLQVAVHLTGGVAAYTPTGASLSVAAGRLSFTYGLRGPAVSVDTACSSSLVAAHTAASALRMGQACTALAGGINLMLSPDTPAAFQKAGMLSPEGRCKTLDAAADGYARAEAAGLLLLELLSGVSSNSSTSSTSNAGLLGVLAGSAVNQDGRSSSLTAPNGPAQQQVMLDAMLDAELVGQQVCLPYAYICYMCAWCNHAMAPRMHRALHQLINLRCMPLPPAGISG
jgi:acyl transferase domain-containing protein